MTKRKTKYRRCKKCKELVIDPDNCAVCENRNPLAASFPRYGEGRRTKPNLDTQEGNSEESF